MAYKLDKGEEYRLDVKGGEYFGQGIYVRKEFLPSTKEEWETFFAIIGKEVLYRLRIPSKSIQGVEKNRVKSNGKLVDKIVWENHEHTPIVQNWLDEIHKMFPSFI